MASISGANTIVLKASYSEGGTECEEGPINAIGYPGMAVTLASNAESLGRHTYALGGTDYVGTGTNVTTSKAPVWVLKEDALRGQGVNDAYAANDNCFVHIAKSGDHLQVLVASGQTIVKGGGLSANSSGASIGKWVADSTNAAVIALENSNGALAADTLVRVKVP